jgi:hypothetical protein
MGSLAGMGTVLPGVAELSAQPRVGEPQFVLHDMNRTANRLSGLFSRHAPEVTHFDDLRMQRIVARQGLDGKVEIQQLHGVHDSLQRQIHVRIERGPLVLPSPLPCAMSACVVHQDVTHNARSEGHELCPVSERRTTGRGNHPQVCFVDQCGGLQSVAGTFFSEALAGDVVQFVVNHGHQFLGCGGIAFSDAPEKLCSLLAHPSSIIT